MKATLRTSKDEMIEPGDVYLQTHQPALRQGPDEPLTYPILWLMCPCGRCNPQPNYLLLGRRDGAPVPSWDLDLDTLTLTPGLVVPGHWRGRLENGEWIERGKS